jgi:hypothetical protein
MTKKVDRFENWVSARVAAQILSAKSGRLINPEYITKLAKSKKQPVRTQIVSNRLLYHKEDIMNCNIRQKHNKPS